jgi:hypothetical protein
VNNVYNDPSYAQIQKKMIDKLFELKKQVDDTDDKYPEMYALTKDLNQ